MYVREDCMPDVWDFETLAEICPVLLLSNNDVLENFIKEMFDLRLGQKSVLFYFYPTMTYWKLLLKICLICKKSVLFFFYPCVTFTMTCWAKMDFGQKTAFLVHFWPKNQVFFMLHPYYLPFFDSGIHDSMGPKLPHML